MKATEALALEACLIALTKLETELPPELHQQVQQLGQAIDAKDSQAIAQLQALVTSHDDLRQHYDIARLSLQEQYRSQERTKDWQSGTNGTVALEQVAIPILSADSFRDAAQRILKVNLGSTTQAEL